VPPRVLLNFISFSAVGHVAEALKYAKGIAAANPGAEIHLLLNAATAVEIAHAANWVTPHAIDPRRLDAPRPCTPLHNVPRNVDYLVTNVSLKHLAPWAPEFRAAHDHVIAHTVTRLGAGYSSHLNTYYADPEREPLPYRPNEPARLALPEAARAWTRDRLGAGGPVITVLLAGSRLHRAPSLRAWHEILVALADRLPGVRLCITGVTRNAATTTAFGAADVAELGRAVPAVETWIDVGLWRQLALVEASDLFLSPHTGFGFLAPLLDTPWLALSHCPWPEVLFNGVPFYSVLPSCGNFPTLLITDSACDRRIRSQKRPVCLEDDAVLSRVPQLVEGAERLLGGMSFEDAVARYRAGVHAASCCTEHFFSYDGALGDLRVRPGIP
jgi:hypothetical protein